MGPEDTDCSICLQRFVHPAQLPCGHVFCFLCIKGCAFHRRRCPICRQQFSIRFFDDPKLVLVDTARGENNSVAPDRSMVPCSEPAASTSSYPTTAGGLPPAVYGWFYEGFAGWWEYDERTSAELEDAFSKGHAKCEIVAAGHIYVVDFCTMSQGRKDHTGRKRRIKRDLITCEKKGIAGIKLTSIQPGKTSVATTVTSASTDTVTGVTASPKTSATRVTAQSSQPVALTDHTYARPTSSVPTHTHDTRYRAISCSSSPNPQFVPNVQMPPSLPTVCPPANVSRTSSRRQSRPSVRLPAVTPTNGPVDSSTTLLPATLTGGSVVGVQPVVHASISPSHHRSTRSLSHH
ncbi:hypothetical protein CRM22_007641 [Opisthorchis felineus]|uniref:E3 ubiquitin-protein ligase n=1 Tax=Opisthorchis felineus TaxID=147828 RepID=A0A4V3SDU9_OPIFE|nr:hypothetical protein CRM22_007641 [Opisthorchis felineus]TGZ62073.1 hypothetical protein CRM22_007641 [Opisthorchis felineus]TGZ62074.1 hypothetical protein CRM22_007641 [Opisthorchis felineus]